MHGPGISWHEHVVEKPRLDHVESALEPGRSKCSVRFVFSHHPNGDPSRGRGWSEEDTRGRWWWEDCEVSACSAEETWGTRPLLQDADPQSTCGLSSPKQGWQWHQCNRCPWAVGRHFRQWFCTWSCERNSRGGKQRWRAYLEQEHGSSDGGSAGYPGWEPVEGPFTGWITHQFCVQDHWPTDPSRRIHCHKWGQVEQGAACQTWWSFCRSRPEWISMEGAVKACCFAASWNPKPCAEDGEHDLEQGRTWTTTPEATSSLVGCRVIKGLGGFCQSQEDCLSRCSTAVGQVNPSSLHICPQGCRRHDSMVAGRNRDFCEEAYQQHEGLGTRVDIKGAYQLLRFRHAMVTWTYVNKSSLTHAWHDMTYLGLYV